MRPLKLLVTVAVSLTAVASAAIAAPRDEGRDRPREPDVPSIARMSQPNNGQALSFDSGQVPVPACSGAAALRPTWQAAADAFGLDWRIIAAITKIESDFGCNMGPSSAGAIGWTQFLPSTWDRWGTDADGDGQADPHNSVDAIFSTARYLRVTGAPGDYRKAIFAYNHADWYVNDVLETAATFKGLSGASFDRLADLAQRAVDERARLSRLQERLDEATIRLAGLRARVKRLRERLDEGRDQLETAQQRWQRAQSDLTDETVRYLSTAQSLQTADGQSAVGDADEQALQVVAGSDPSDAVVAWQSARSLLDHQAHMLGRVRAVAQRADTARDDLQELVAARERMTSEAVQARAGQVEAIADIRVSTRQAKARLARSERAAELYAQAYERHTGRPGDLNPALVAGLLADRDKPGKLRWPVTGPVTSPYCEVRSWESCHPGIDIGVASGTPVRASGDGVVSRVQTEAQSGGYGNFVCVSHTDRVSTCSAHLSRIDTELGARVQQGDRIGLAGCTGRCFGPHVHFEVRIDDQHVDPAEHMPGGPLSGAATGGRTGGSRADD